MAFNRRLAVAYARQWALSINPKYPRFANDCTSFVSQSMLAGGWKMVGEQSFSNRKGSHVWWCGGSMLTRASYTWGGAQNFYDFVRVSGRGVLAKRMELAPGDVVQIKNGRGHVYHSMVVTGKTSHDLALSYHTSDHLDEPLSDIVSRLPSDYKLVFWRIRDASVQFG